MQTPCWFVRDKWRLWENPGHTADEGWIGFVFSEALMFKCRRTSTPSVFSLAPSRLSHWRSYVRPNTRNLFHSFASEVRGEESLSIDFLLALSCDVASLCAPLFDLSGRSVNSSLYIFYHLWENSLMSTETMVQHTRNSWYPSIRPPPPHHHSIFVLIWREMVMVTSVYFSRWTHLINVFEMRRVTSVSTLPMIRSTETTTSFIELMFLDFYWSPDTDEHVSALLFLTNVTKRLCL